MKSVRSAQPPRGRPGKIDRRGITSLSIGHFTVDMAQGVPPALLVFLTPKLDLSYKMAAGVVLAISMSAALVQPFSGYLSDRPRGAMWLLSAGTFLGCAGVACAAVAPSYVLVLLCVFIGGLGVGVFHPEAAKIAGHVSRARPASGMSLFAIGGNAGVAIGPILTSTLILTLGFEGVLLLIIPGILAAVLLVSETSYLRSFAPAERHERNRSDDPGQPVALGLLVTISVLRSIGYFGIFTFVPLYEVSQGASEGESTRLLTYILAAGAAATLVAGRVADRIGGRPVLLWSGVVCVPLLVFYVLNGGLVAVVAVMLAGAAISGTFGVQIVMAQQYMPSRVAMASALCVGVPIGLGAAAAVFLGAIADAVDLRAALLVTAVAPALGALLTIGLPPARRTRPTPVRDRVAELS